jgi:hypothetical protein
VLSLILVLVVVWAVLSLVLAAWTLWFQGYIYSEPVEQIYWRAPASGAALALFLGLWTFLDFRAPGSYQTLTTFSASDSKTYAELRIPSASGGEDIYKMRKTAQGRPEYFKGGDPLRSRPEKIIVVEKDHRYVFEPDRDAKGNFKVASDGYLHYRDKEHGLEMREDYPGHVTIRHPGRGAANVLLNLAYLAVWFVCLWLLLQFQWPHALGLAVVCWLVMILFVVPPVLSQAEDLAQQRAGSQTEREASAPSSYRTKRGGGVRTQARSASEGT